MGAEVVDYAAWNKGYMPPSEHVLIDQLAYRGAKVILGTDYGPEQPALWLVMRGKRPARKHMKALMTLLLDCLEEEECSPETTSQTISLTTTDSAPLSDAPVSKTDGEDAAAPTGDQSKQEPGTN